MSTVGSALKKFAAFLFKFVAVLLFCIFGLWLLKLVYFPQFEVKKSAVAAPSSEKEDLFGDILKRKGPIPQSHFHMVDEYVAQPEPYPPVCMTCHGTYPHSKGQKVRSLLNAHTGFVACSVCHSRMDPAEEGMDFAWVDRKSGMITPQFLGAYGKYSAKIYPVKLGAGGSKEIFRPVDEKDAQKFIDLKAKFTPDQIAEAKIKLHSHITDKPVFCNDCHKKDGYFDFAKLGFPLQRVDHLNSTEVVGLIAKYEKFYFPSAIDFGEEKALE